MLVSTAKVLCVEFFHRCDHCQIVDRSGKAVSLIGRYQWNQVCEWLEGDPDLTGLELFERLHRQSPGVYPDGQLRTLQRRLKHWRMGMARSLVFGVHAGTANKELLPPFGGRPRFSRRRTNQR